MGELMEERLREALQLIGSGRCPLCVEGDWCGRYEHDPCIVEFAHGVLESSEDLEELATRLRRQAQADRARPILP